MEDKSQARERNSTSENTKIESRASVQLRMSVLPEQVQPRVEQEAPQPTNRERGPAAFKALKEKHEALLIQNENNVKDISLLMKRIDNMHKDKTELQRMSLLGFILMRLDLLDELSEKLNVIATLKGREMRDELVQRSINETEQILIEATSKSAKLIAENKRLTHVIEDLKAEISKLNKVVSESESKRAGLDTIIINQEHQMKEMKVYAGTFEFQIDELKFQVAKYSRRNEVLEKDMKFIGDENQFLKETREALLQEKTMLQNRIKEIILENNELSEVYQAIKKDHEESAKLFNVMKQELVDNKLMCEAALKQKKETFIKLEQVSAKLKSSEERVKKMEIALSKKDMEIEHLIAKVQSTIMEYEERLDLKEHKLADISAKLAEENRKQKQALSQVTIDPDFINSLEKKYQAKEAVLLQEITNCKSKLDEKDSKISQAVGDLEELQKKSFQPRMLRLAEIERGMSEQLEMIAVSEEKIETRFLCPHDLVTIDNPETLMPCTHTFCTKCLRQISAKQKGLPITNCPSCHTQVISTFRNVHLEMLIEDFNKRKELTDKLLDWFGVLKSISDESRGGSNDLNQSPDQGQQA